MTDFSTTTSLTFEKDELASPDVSVRVTDLTMVFESSDFWTGSAFFLLSVVATCAGDSVSVKFSCGFDSVTTCDVDFDSATTCNVTFDATSSSFNFLSDDGFFASPLTPADGASLTSFYKENGNKLTIGKQKKNCWLLVACFWYL